MKKQIKKKEQVKKKQQIKESIFTKFVPRNKTEKIMCFIFLILLITVIILSVVAIKTTWKVKKNDITNTISITDHNSNYVMNIDISNMKKSAIKKYKFKITNYNEKILTEDLSYNISLNTADNPVTVKLYKNDKLLDLDQLTMELKKDVKQEDIYKLVLEANERTKKDTSVIITIVS